MNRKERRLAEKQGKSHSGNSFISANPALVDAYAQVVALQHMRQIPAAISLCQQMLSLEPNNASVLALLGTLCLQQGEFIACIKVLDKAISLNTVNATAFVHRGVAHFNLGMYDKSLADYEKALTLSPRSPDVYNNRGFTFFTLENYTEAIKNYDKAIALNARFYEAWVNKGDALEKLQRYAEALTAYDKAIACSAQPVQAYNNRANLLVSMKRYLEALASSDQAIALNPSIADLHNTRATILKLLDKEQEALDGFEKALSLNPHLQDAWINRGNIFYQLGKHQSAIASYDKALEINPLKAEAAWNKSHSLLVMGEYEQGWQMFESRFSTPNISEEINNISSQSPKWLGAESLIGKTIVLYHEQGLGDTLQFCRYVPMVEALGAKVIVEVPPSLLHILSTLKTDAQFIPKGNHLLPYDFRCPIMSLPLAFKTTLNKIPSDIPYLFADNAKTTVWREKLGNKTNPRIGLVWSGSTVHKNDRKRSIALEQFLPLMACDADFHCLQKEIRSSDLQQLANTTIYSHANELLDFSDTAALIMEMDLIISVDTSVVHLAGALGKPVWILLPFAPDFRWLLQRQDSPWYPTATLFRQETSGDWQSVMEKVKDTLSNLLRYKN